MKIIWVITKYNPNNLIEMRYIVPDIMIVNINIQLEKHDDNKHTRTTIRYTYTALSEKGNTEVEKKTEEEFKQTMIHWQKAINHYLIHGKIISSSDHH